jgi:adenylosuccinate lyase
MNLSPLTAVASVDGRYAARTRDLRPICSEFGLIKYRVIVEIRWFEALAQEPGFQQLEPLDTSATHFLAGIIENFDETGAQRVKAIEAVTNHDVKAVEYFLKEQFAEHETLAKGAEFLHFACTSEDINNLAYGLMVKEACGTVLRGEMTEIESLLSAIASAEATRPMLSRTHGQTASPTTLGKEFANVLARLQRQHTALKEQPLLGKINGAVGNFNAHVTACPNIDWPAFAERFVTALGLQWNPYTTQIEPHDWMAELAQNQSRYNTILIDLCRDVWAYISLGYFKQKTV